MLPPALRAPPEIRRMYVNGPGLPSAGKLLVGEVKKKVADRGFGFIRAEDGMDYFFHLTDLRGLEFDTLPEGLSVVFEVKKEPSMDKAGAAQNVRRSVT